MAVSSLGPVQHPIDAFIEANLGRVGVAFAVRCRMEITGRIEDRLRRRGDRVRGGYRNDHERGTAQEHHRVPGRRVQSIAQTPRQAVVVGREVTRITFDPAMKSWRQRRSLPKMKSASTIVTRLISKSSITPGTIATISTSGISQR